ncbi:2,5-diketo-D-gluconate reductase A [Microcella alkaliphila]|uniref:2,5-diketo-D-gluconate reductase A n=2 Tax=Microcella alkaliphila TaxID=279828 RepID=A0A4Q7TNM2_9MICO|nr:2,5-diketo-D-gluconate reductase A [Microcella alkaliphila]
MHAVRSLGTLRNTVCMTAAEPLAPRITLSDGTSIPQLGLGVYKVPAEQTAELVAGAIELGYRHVDTAALYRNEAEVGEGVCASGVPRDELYVTSKVWNDRHGVDETRAAFLDALDASGLDYFDLYLIHWPAPRQDRYVEAWKALIGLREQGLVRSIGVSNFEPHHLQRLVDETGVAPVVDQVELHPWLPQRDVRAAASAMGAAVESWSPLARGRVLEAGSRDREVLSNIAARHDKTPAQVALRWHVQQGLIVIPKSTSLKRVAENADIFDFELTATDMAEIAQLETGERTGRHPDDLG